AELGDPGARRRRARRAALGARGRRRRRAAAGDHAVHLHRLRRHRRQRRPGRAAVVHGRHRHRPPEPAAALAHAGRAGPAAGGDGCRRRHRDRVHRQRAGRAHELGGGAVRHPGPAGRDGGLPEPVRDAGSRSDQAAAHRSDARRSDGAGARAARPHPRDARPQPPLLRQRAPAAGRRLRRVGPRLARIPRLQPGLGGRDRQLAGGTVDTLASTFSSSDNDFDWAYFGTDMHDVPRAWKLFLGSGRFLEPRIKVTVLDGGFRLDKLDGLEGVTLAQPPCPEPNCPNPSPCQGGFSCPWHGTNTVNSGFAEPGNFLGGGGPGWPALNGDGKDLTLAWSAADPLSYSVNGVADLFRGTDLLSMSFGEDIPAGVCATGVCTALELMTKTISADGTLQLAAAGNGGFDDDRLQCFSVKIPLSDVASGIFGGSGKPARIKSCPFESTFTWPCESWGVDCVDGSLFTSHDRDPKSNFGSKKGTIAYRASFTTLDAGIDTANDNNFYVQQSMGTSESTPLVAGIAKLIWTAVPAMSVGDVEACLSAAGEFVVASSALRCALGSPANFPPAVQINLPGDQT